MVLIWIISIVCYWVLDLMCYYKVWKEILLDDDDYYFDEYSNIVVSELVYLKLNECMDELDN